MRQENPEHYIATPGYDPPEPPAPAMDATESTDPDVGVNDNDAHEQNGNLSYRNPILITIITSVIFK